MADFLEPSPPAGAAGALAGALPDAADMSQEMHVHRNNRARRDHHSRSERGQVIFARHDEALTAARQQGMSARPCAAVA